MSEPQPLAWVAEGYERPATRFSKAPAGRLQPPRKDHLPAKITPHITGLRTDEELAAFVERTRGSTALVNFGSSWCHHCHALFPAFLALTKRLPALKYAVAQVDYMHEGVRGITYTPTIAVYRGGRKVDQFFGANEQQLRDHIWLWSQRPAGGP